jgi:hypothetical protein
LPMGCFFDFPIRKSWAGYKLPSWNNLNPPVQESRTQVDPCWSNDKTGDFRLAEQIWNMSLLATSCNYHQLSSLWRYQSTQSMTLMMPNNLFGDVWVHVQMHNLMFNDVRWVACWIIGSAFLFNSQCLEGASRIYGLKDIFPGYYIILYTLAGGSVFISIPT